MADLPKWATPQKWMKNPVATNSGWVNSVTGEKLSGHRGLKDNLAALTPAPVAKKETPKKKTAKTKSED